MAEGKDLRSPVARARSLLRDKRYADALQVCTDELARGVDDPELRLVAAQSLLAQGRHEGAKKEAQQVVRIDPTQADAHRILAEVAMTRGEHNAAREHLGRVLELDPDDEKSRKTLDSLRPGGPGGAAAAATTAAPPRDVLFDEPQTAKVPKALQAELLSPGAPRQEESGPLELSSDDLEEDEGSVPHIDPFSGEAFKVSSGETLAVTDSMMEELPRPPGDAIPPARGLRTLNDIDAEKIAATAAAVARAREAEARDAELPAVTRTPAPARLPAPGPRTPAPTPAARPASPAARTPAPTPEPAASSTPPPSKVEDQWSPPAAMDTGAGTGVKYEGTLRLPALGDLPEEEEAPTMPLLRPSGPPQPQLRLDPLAAKPVSHEHASEREHRPTGPHPPLAAERPHRPTGPHEPLGWSPPQPAPRIAPSGPTIRGPLDESSEFEEFGGVEPASVPLPTREPEPIPRETLDPIKARAELAQRRQEAASSDDDEGGDLLSMFAGKASASADPSLPEIDLSAQPRGRARGGTSGKLAALVDEEPPEQATFGDEGSGVEPRPFTPEELERQLAAAATTAFPKSKPERRAGKGRWILVAFLGLVLGGGGLFGYLWYRSYKYVQGEWAKVREAVHRSTPDGYKEAIAAAQRIAAHKKNDPNAAAALGMCDAAMSIEFGDDKLKTAKEQLERAKGTDSEWRTAASAFLSLMDDPASAEGYLRKAIEVYPESAILPYLRGRALAATEAREKAAESYGAALKLEPKYVAAKIALATLVGQQQSGYADALRALDEILGASPDNVQALIERARLRTRHAKELDSAAADARRVVGDLASKAGAGQVGWAQLVLAQIGWLEKKLPAASSALDAAAQSPPCCDSSFRYELAGELMKHYRMADAEKQLKRALELKPKQPEYLQRMARVLLELDDPSGAGTYLQNAPARQLETRILIGRLAFSQGNYEKALKDLGGVLNENKDSLEAAIYLALAGARNGATTEAVASLEKLAGAHAEDPEVRKAMGQVQLWAGDLAKADAALKQAWKLTKLDPAIPTLLGQVSARQHNVDRAVKRFERALQGRPEYRGARIGLALLYMTMGKLAEARQQQAAISEADRKKPDVHALAAQLDLAEGKLDAAKSAIAEAEGAGAPPSVVARLTGELALARKDGKAAVEQLRKASKLAKGKDAETLALLGRAQSMAGALDDAYDTFHLALKEDPGSPAALLELGKIAIKDGEHPVAVKRLNEALAKIKERKLPARMTAAAHTALGQAYLRQKDTGRAMTNLQDAIDLDPTAAEPQLFMGQTYDKLDRPQRSVVHYAKALQLDPSRTEVYELLGRAYAKLNDTKNALKFFEDYLRTNPPAAKAREIGREVKKLQAAAEGQ